MTDQAHLPARWHKSTLAMAIRKFVATLVTLGSGGSGGLEASAALIGENLGAWHYKLRSNKASAEFEDLAKGLTRPWVAPNRDYLQAAQLSGIAAAVTVLLGAPLSSAFFASEVMYRNRPLLEKTFYSLLAAVTAQVISVLFTGAVPSMFEIEEMSYPPIGDLRYWLGLALMGIVLAFVGQVYRVLNVQFNVWFQKGIKNRFVRLLVGFGITGGIALAVLYLTRWFGITEHGLELVLGSGESMVVSAFAGQVTLAMAVIGLVAKMLATLSTIKSGGSAGLLVPSFFFGTMVAVAFAQLFQSEPMPFIVPALTGSLIAIVNAPIAAILFAVEEFGEAFLAPALLILIVTGLLSHPKTIYHAQQVAQESIEILPGYDIEPISVPAAWIGKTLDDLNLHEQSEVQVVGLLDRSAGDEQPNVLFGDGLNVATTLVEGDIILVYGQEEKVHALGTAATQL